MFTGRGENPGRIAKKRVHELAKELGVSSKDMIVVLAINGITVRSASSTLEPRHVALLREQAASGRFPGPNSSEAAGALNALRGALGGRPPKPSDPAGHESSEGEDGGSRHDAKKDASLATPPIEEAPSALESDHSAVASEEPVARSPHVISAHDNSEAFEAVGPVVEAMDPSDGEPLPAQPSPLAQGHLEFQRGDAGVSFEKLIVPYLLGATEVRIVDPYIRTLSQARNLMELLEALVRAQPSDVVTEVWLRTSKDRQDDPKKDEAQTSYLDRIAAAFKDTGLTFRYTVEAGLHGRTITANSGWRILLDRGLDIFDRVPSDPLHLGNRMQEHRNVRSFYISYQPIPVDS
ncbi:translation initiation factor IF-2 N-terminal domain-containing protein [Paenarthrobacter sp. YJN-5]|uniref:translation initiation factor IF-2 N-terminal domain-containing protein n=1 Tax=Paenarthrobacter sp. YJN-5 TaxID=2735316 RepID=UPI001877DA67|nr:translation initiation factor IF-2 N-terminal domain-containing protein [Paenarthrobacter sp. YJN-5]QOT19331.1 hypothetical protein HMI59_21990 [Paenarthrobacter sp. YJN-5]